MRILLDECVDPRVKQLFGDLDAVTVHQLGWDALEDGPLLASAQKALLSAVREVRPGQVIHVKTPRIE